MAENEQDVADDIFREVDEGLRADRLRALARRYALAAAAVIGVAAAGVGAWQYQSWQQRQADRAAAATYFAALRTADSSHIMPGETTSLTPQQHDALARLATLDGAPAGLRTMARFQRATLLVSSGDAAGALRLWNAIAEDSAADPLLRSLASLFWVQHQIDHGDPATLRSRLATLDAEGMPWRDFAMEAEALLDLRQGHAADARRRLAQLSAEADIPEGMRSRAGGLLQTLNANPL